MDCSYSVVIRTLGNAGEKYRRLMDSISNQTIKPEEIIVVIPEGYGLDYVAGNERVVYSHKGMVTQRAVGIMGCHSEYMLVVDDDVEFAPSMVEELFAYSLTHNLDACLPMEGISDDESNTIHLGLPLPARVRGAFTGQVYISRKKSPFLDVITTTAGHRIYANSNQKDQCYLVQCGCFQCFFMKTESAKRIHFEEETWLEEGTITQYASYDDPTFFYKLYLMGGRSAYALRTRYVHLDATAGRQTKTLLESKIIRYYSVAKNRTIFWCRFLWKESRTWTRKMVVLAGGLYGLINYSIWSTVICLRPKFWKAIKALFIGYHEAFAIIRRQRKTAVGR